MDYNGILRVVRHTHTHTTGDGEKYSCENADLSWHIKYYV